MAKILYSVAPLLFLVLQRTAAQQYDLTLYHDAGCGAGDTTNLMFFESSADTCQQGTIILPDWEKNAQGQTKVYLDGSGLAENCKIGLVRENTVEPNKCGDIFAVIDGATGRDCRAIFIDEAFGGYYCCDDLCNDVIPAALLSRTKRAVRDVTEVKRASPFQARAAGFEKRQDGCSFQGTPTTTGRTQSPQKITGTQSCTSEDGCTLSNSVSVGFSATQTFGISTEVGASFFDIVQASVSFSYEYSYTENEERTITYSVSQSGGSTGYLTFTPTLECTDGAFSGNCDGWNTGEDGQVCIPKILAGGAPDGTVLFVEEL